MKALLTTLLFVAGLSVGVDAVEAKPPVSAVRVCPDSNGTAPGGSVYLYYNRLNSRWCVVQRGQRVHALRTPSARACVSLGGHSWTPSQRICWDI